MALFPHSRPSTRPAATATTFFNAPPSETPRTSFETATRNFSVWKSSAQRFATSRSRHPIVVSENESLATSLAMLAPERAAHSIPRCSLMTSEKMWISLFLTSTPLMSEIPCVSFGT